MTTQLEALESEALKLASSERAHLAEVILESLQDTALPDIEADWQREITARVVAYDNGDIKTYSATDVFAEAKRIAK